MKKNESTPDLGRAMTEAIRLFDDEAIIALLKAGASEDCSPDCHPMEACLYTLDGTKQVVDVEMAKRLVAAGCSIDGQKDGKPTLLESAVKFKKLKAAKDFMKLGADPLVSSGDGQTPLLAAYKQCWEAGVRIMEDGIVKKLSDPGFDLESKDLSGRTYAERVLFAMDREIQSISATNAATPCRPSVGALALAIEEGRLKNPSTRTLSGEPILLSALTAERFDSTQRVSMALVKAGAKVRDQDKRPSTSHRHALARCLSYVPISHTELRLTANMLIDAGADFSKKDESGRTSLHRACTFGFGSTISLLIGKGADIEARDDDGLTPFECLSWIPDAESLESFLDAGISPNATKKNGVSLLADACFRGDSKSMALLLARGADPSMASKWPNWLVPHKGTCLPIHAAALGFSEERTRDGAEKCVFMLFEKGCDPDAKSETGLTPSDVVWPGAKKSFEQILLVERERRELDILLPTKPSDAKSPKKRI